MKLKTKAILVGAGIAVVTGVVLAVRAVGRRARRVLSSKMRRALTEIVQMRAEDFVPGGSLGQSLFRSYIDKLDNKQLAALCALVQVGYFIKVSSIDPNHPSEEQVEQAANKYLVEERLAPAGREDLLRALDTSDARDALIRAFSVLGNA